jgi:hypothetical protein
MNRFNSLFLIALVVYVLNFIILISYHPSELVSHPVLRPHRQKDTNQQIQFDESIPPPYSYNASEYEILRKQTLKSFDNVTTVAYPHGPFGGFRNVFMSFSGVMILTKAANHSQIIAPSIKWKDLFGTNERIRHDVMFDVVEWNKHYPILPRFVEYEKERHPDISFVGPAVRWNVKNYIKDAKRPFAVGEFGMQAQNVYKQYVKNVVDQRKERSELDLAILQGAFRPHPEIQSIMDAFLRRYGHEEYMVLHARIEPDMQRHNACSDKKVTNLTEIIQSLEEFFPDPPTSHILFIFNRGILENEVSDTSIDNELAEYNLRVLNDARKHGMWNGRTQVLEAGIGLAKESNHPIYSKYYSLTGSIIDFFLAVEAKIFVGTEVSSFSVDVEITRFYRGKKGNYHYTPNGLVWTTPPSAQFPPRFSC